MNEDARSTTPETGEERYRRTVVTALRDFADKIEAGDVAPSRFNIRAPVRVAGVDRGGNPLYEIGDKRQLYVETVPVRPATPSEPKAQEEQEEAKTVA